MHVERAIERYVAVGLSPAAEARLRRHVSRCARCRAKYEREVQLLRALEGDVTAPAREEEQRARARARRAVGLAPGERERMPLSERALFVPWRGLSVAAGVAAVALVALLVGLPGGLQGGAPPVVVAHVKEARGLRIGGAEVAKGRAVMSGERVTVDARGGAALALVIGGELRAYPGARLALPSASDVVLEEGKVWLVLPKLERRLEVHTPSAVARVVGTSFLVVHERQETDVRVVEGAVEVRAKSAAGPVLVKGSQRTRVQQGRAPEPAMAYASKQDQDEWQRFWAELLRSLQEGIQKGLQSLETALKPR